MNDDEIQVIIDLLDSYRIALDNVLYSRYQPAELTEELRKINRSVDLLEALHSGAVIDPEVERLLTQAEVSELPVVRLEGSEVWSSGYQYGEAINKAFPGVAGSDFAYALEYNDRGPVKEDYSNLLTVNCTQFGERDNGSWKWTVSVLNEAGEVENWAIEGWCDFTGWDCQSGVAWSKQ